MGRSGSLLACLGIILGVSGEWVSAADSVVLRPVATGFVNPIGIDHHDPTNRVVLSVNYPSGLPHNFELVAADGTRSRFSNLSGFTEEVKIATVRRGPCQGGFTAGELFTGTGVPGVIARISPDGSSVQNPWVTLPGETGLLRGSLFQDRYCSFDGDLIAVTTVGNVWRVSSAGTAMRLTSLGTHLEGLTTVPNDPERYGPWAGRILAGAEEQTRIYAIDAGGAATPYFLSIRPEDIDIIPAGENFFGVDFGGRTIWGAPAEAFAGRVGDLLVAQEFPGILWQVHWNGATFEAVEVARVAQWEHVTFSTAGIPPIPPATPCQRPTLPAPAGFTLTGNQWTAAVSVTPRDGLVVRDVTLGSRYMAREISAPYFVLDTSAVPQGLRAELRPEGDETAARSRLIEFRQDGGGWTPGQPAFVEATYAIDRIPAGSSSCLVVRQRYEFWPEEPHGGCEPSRFVRFPPRATAPLACSRWKPIIEYEFVGAEGESLESLNVPQRVFLRDEDRSPNSAATFQDSDESPFRTLGRIIERRQDIRTEEAFSAVVRGDAGDWDNYHQSFKRRITEPKGLPLVKPGCPECIHIHWRWGKAVPPEFPDRHDGLPLIPDRSDQDVEFAVVAWRTDEEHPEDFHALLDGESLGGGDIVLWYSATGHRASDVFFRHGGFFQPPLEADLGLAVAVPPTVGLGQNVAYSVTISNNGPSVATGVLLQHNWSLPNQTFFVPEESSPQCLSTTEAVLCELGDIAPGQTITLALVFEVDSFFGADVLASFTRVEGDRADPDPKNNRAHVVIRIVQ